MDNRKSFYYPCSQSISEQALNVYNYATDKPRERFRNFAKSHDREKPDSARSVGF